MGAGGGSAIDVAKYVAMKTDAVFFAIPTTAGTGSESTPFAVLYKNGEKLSVTNEKGLPQYVLLEGETLLSLPYRQKYATMCDALSHAVESIFSVNETDESRRYAVDAIKRIEKYRQAYLQNEHDALQGMLEAANLAGQAIAITKTTVSHALAYKMTTLFGLPHGEAVMLTLPNSYNYLRLSDDVVIKEKLTALRDAFDVDTCEAVLLKLYEYKKGIKYNIPEKIDDNMMNNLCESVNVERLANYPISLKGEDIREIYMEAFFDTYK